MKKVLDQSEVALNEIVYGLGTQLCSLAKNLVCLACTFETTLDGLIGSITSE